MEYEEGQRLQGSDGNIYVVRGGVPVLEGGTAMPAAISLGGGDPLLQERRAAELQILQERAAAAARDAANASQGPVPAGFRRTNTGGLEPIPGGPADSSRPQGGLTAAQRADMRKGYDGLRNLEAGISELERLFERGPGATSGVAGLADYLPTETNSRFDNAANRLPAFVANALGLSGQQFNTPAEQQLFIGSYLPQAGDRDNVIRDKIGRLRGLLDNARSSAESQLGIEPSQPDAQAAPRSGSDRTPQRVVDPGQGQSFSLASGETRRELDPARRGVAARINQMLRSGVPDDEIRQYAVSVGATPESVQANLDFRRARPDYRGNYNAADLEYRTVANDTTTRLLNRAAGSPGGAYFANAADALTLGTADEFAANPGLARAGLDTIRAENPTASLLGTVTGGALAAGTAELGATRFGLQGARAALAGDGLFGAAYGAGSSEPGNRLTGAALGGVAGVGGGMFGRGLTRTGGRALRGVQNASVDELRTRGVPLTFGQAVGQSGRLGAIARGVEDRLSGIPIVGDVVNARRLEGLRAFNRTAFDDALEPIGQSSLGNVGEEGVDRAQALVSGAYDDALRGVQVARDPQFTAEFGAAVDAGSRIPRTGPEFAFQVGQQIDPHFAAGSPVSGRQVQDALQMVRGTDFGSDAMGSAANQAMGQVGGAIRGLVDRQAPDVLPALSAADQAYRRTGIVRDSVSAARSGGSSGEGGLFTAAQLARAADANARRFGGSQGTTRQPFFDLTQAARDILPNRIPDSGTAGRILVGGTTVGGGLGYATGDTQAGAQNGLLAAALLAAGGSRPGQRALVAAATRRPETLRRAGDALTRRSRIGGMFGAPVGYQVLAPVMLQDGY